MKKTLLLMALVCLCFSSCITMEQFTATNVIDYSRFTKNGIFVTESNSVNFDYTPIGSVVSVTRGKVESTFLSLRVDMDKAFTDVGKKLADVNADGLINLKIVNTYEEPFYYTTITGMAIRRNDKTGDEHKTFKEVIGNIDGISLEVISAYDSGTLIQTSAELNAEQLKKAWKQFFYSPKQVMFYTAEGYAKKTAYAALVDNQIVIYATNEFIPLK